MSNLTPMPPDETGLQLAEPMPAGSASSGAKFRPQKLLYFLRKYWWIPLLTLMLSVGAEVYIFFHTPPVFVSYGQLWETAKLQIPDGASFSQDRNNFLGTQSQLLRSRKLRQLTLAYLRSSDSNHIVLGKNGRPLPVDIHVLASDKSSVYTIEATSANPAYTPAYLNALMKQYLEYRKNIRAEVSGDTLASIAEQVQQLERKMKFGQEALTDYERSNNFAVLQEENQIEATYLANLKTKLSDYQLQLKLLGAREIEGEAGEVQTTTNISGKVFDSLQGSQQASGSISGEVSADRQIEQLKLKRQRLSKYLRPQHPKMVKLNEEIKQAEKLVQFYRTQNHDQIAAARKALEIKIRNVQQFVKQWETKVEDSNRRIAEVSKLKQAVQRNQGMYDRLSSLLQNVEITRNIDQETLAILDPATSATRSYSAAKRSLVQSVILGLGLGLGIVFLIAWRDDKFSSVVEVTERFGDNVVGQVPELPKPSRNGSMMLLQHHDDRHMFAESYRNLRSALLYLGVEGERPRVLLITSAIPAEGKSTVAVNLARALAMGGSRVLLIDADMRRGHIHEVLQLNSKPGLTELLRGKANIEQVLQSTDLSNFSFVARGGTSRNPGDLLLNSAFDELIVQLRRSFDFVLVDSCPVFAADDAATLAPRVDGCLMVVRSRYSQGRVVREALEVLFQRQARVLGLVLNRTDGNAPSYYSYKYAEYYATADTGAADGENDA